MVVELPGGGIATTETLVTWAALTADAGAPAFVRAVLKTVAKSVLNVVGSLIADSALAVTAAAFDGGTWNSKAMAQFPARRLTSDLKRRDSVTVTLIVSAETLK